MAQNGIIHVGGQDMILFTPTVITTALTASVTTPVTLLSNMSYLGVHCKFVYGSGGTTLQVWVQTSLDGGLTWADIMSFAHTTASLSRFSVCAAYPSTAFPAVTALTDGTLADNTILNGLLGSRIRLKITSTGTYATSSTLSIYGVAKG